MIISQDDSITIESATSSEADMAALVGATPPEEPPAAPANDIETTDRTPPVETPPPTVAAPTDTRSEFEQKVDELDPPLPNETPEQRTVRMSRGEKRILGLLSRTKATEDQLQAAREEITRLKAAPASAQPAPVTPSGDASPALVLPTFAFPAWDQYSEDHPEATHEEYIDARQDARDTHKTEVARLTTEHDTRVRVTRERADRLKAVETETRNYVNDFRASQPDYDDVMATAQDLPLPDPMHAAMVAQKALGPAIALYLAQHRDEHLRIAALDPVEQIGEIRDLAKTLKASATPPAPAAEPPIITTPAPARPTIPASAPSRPLSTAPAPVSEIRGSASPTKSLAQLAAESEDADAYIVRRQQERKAFGLRR